MTTITLASKLDALLSAGFTYKAIAERAGCDTSTIFRIRSGAISNPSYSVGTAIDAMHSELPKPPKPKKVA
ncbi:helix-turn-helix transcriptional regulator [Pseudomonas sp. JS3066]|uniref:helix-turn-helix domain-containing protein n=1 Tax=Pseudomonas sp. JS3066 TaxID=3090665 RepID=UPI002E7BB43D|nr:helix-turn-helix transcriptional regulator [Pseudomonas sp. JS3066]WVK91162.1 helix-turn-helix transcriptional regulator [Pseudomonas sp. JS3066]